MTDWRNRLATRIARSTRDVRPDVQRMRRAVLAASRPTTRGPGWSRAFAATAAALTLICVALLTTLQGARRWMTGASRNDRPIRRSRQRRAMRLQRRGSSCISPLRGDADHLGVRSRLRDEGNIAMNVRPSFLRCALLVPCWPPRPRTPGRPRIATSRSRRGRTPSRLPRRGFNVVLLLGDMQDASGSGHGARSQPARR